MNPPIAAGPEDEWDDELFQEALKLLRVPGNQDAAPLTRSVIQMFKNDLEQAEAAPRISDLRKKLEKIYQCSRDLERLLNDVDPYFQQALFAYTSLDDHPKSPDGQLEGPDGQLGGFSKFHPHLFRDSQQFMTALSGMAKSADLVVKKMPIDSGRRGTLFDILQQSPKRLLVVRCWELFWQFRPGDARGTLRGDFHTFCDYLFELTTGEDPNKEGAGVGLFSYVKEVAKVCNELVDRNPALDRLGHMADTTLGLISETSLAAALFGSPRQIMDDLDKRPR